MKKILVMGDAMTDEYVYTTCERRSPEDLNIFVYKHHKIERKLGGALNVAANIASLLKGKAQVDFSGIISSSQKTMAEKFGINISSKICHKISDARSIKKQRIIQQQKSGEQKQVCRIDYNDKFSTAKSLSWIANCYENIDVKSYDCIVISDYKKGTLTCDMSLMLKDYCNLVVVDTKKKDLLCWSKIKKCIVKINEKEHKLAENIELVDRIVTTGERGSHYYKKGYVLSWQSCCLADEISQPNVIGAGDAYLAGMVTEYIDSGCVIDVPSMMQAATLAASQSVSSFGTENTLKPLEKQTQHLFQESITT